MLYSTDKKRPLISTVYKQSSPSLVVSQVYWAKLTMAPQAVFGVASLQVTKPVPHFVHFPLFSVHPGARQLERRHFFLNLACLQSSGSCAQLSVLCRSSQTAGEAGSRRGREEVSN